MPLPERDVVEDVLADFGRLVVQAILDGWKDFTESDKAGRWQWPRSRANYVFEEIVIRLREAFANEPRVRIIDKDETCQFIVDDRVIFRIKLANDIGFSSNVPTQAALAFHEHEPDLFGFTGHQRVEVVYQLNTLQTEIFDVKVVARDSGRIVWSYSLVDRDAGVVELPVRPPDTEPPAKPVVRPVGPRGTDKAQDKS